MPRPKANHEYLWLGQPTPYEDLAQPWERFKIDHKLTTKRLQKFAEDYCKALAETADGTQRSTNPWRTRQAKGS